MKYRLEQETYEVHTMEVTQQEWDKANAIFKAAINHKHPHIDTKDLKHDTIVITDGIYRVEFRVKIV